VRGKLSFRHGKIPWRVSAADFDMRDHPARIDDPNLSQGHQQIYNYPAARAESGQSKLLKIIL
jgi:hypothetical protein